SERGAGGIDAAEPNDQEARPLAGVDDRAVHRRDDGVDLELGGAANEPNEELIADGLAIAVVDERLALHAERGSHADAPGLDAIGAGRRDRRRRLRLAAGDAHGHGENEGISTTDSRHGLSAAIKATAMPDVPGVDDIRF